ncbi:MULTISPECIES: hypothetical protein [Serratia]|uniref:hypothetical protein n=1 Tax=Serratia TaxID=613 RepID=UPI001D00ABDA|nr:MULTISPECIES: hypothetical protein [Serratia]
MEINLTVEVIFMVEEVYNLFYFSPDEKVITHVGIVPHTISGSDDDKLAFLKTHIYADLPSCKYYDVDPRAIGDSEYLTARRFMALARSGEATIVFELALEGVKAPSNPLIIYTAVVAGTIKIDSSTEINKPVRRDDFEANIPPGVKEMPDYLNDYIVDGGFKIKELLVDDHVKPIHLLFNNKHYLSSVKLLMSFIDTLGFLEFGEVNKAFPMWLDKYCDLSVLQITSSELYELRHSILHMTNLNSRKVVQGVERRISYSIGPLGTPTRTHSGIVFFSYIDFIHLLEAALDKWLATYDNDKVISFIERYDQIVREQY